MSDDTIENPLWLVAAIDQRVALLKEAGGSALQEIIDRGDYRAIVLALTDPESEDKIEEWQFTCDHCGRVHPPDGDEFRLGSVTLTLTKHTILEITFGACESCLEVRDN